MRGFRLKLVSIVISIILVAQVKLAVLKNSSSERGRDCDQHFQMAMENMGVDRFRQGYIRVSSGYIRLFDHMQFIDMPALPPLNILRHQPNKEHQYIR